MVLSIFLRQYGSLKLSENLNYQFDQMILLSKGLLILIMFLEQKTTVELKHIHKSLYDNTEN